MRGYRRSDIPSLCKNASDWTVRDNETGNCLGLCPFLVQCCFAVGSQSLCSKILDKIICMIWGFTHIEYDVALQWGFGNALVEACFNCDNALIY